MGHMIKEFLKQSLQGLSGFNKINLSQLANVIIDQSGKCGSVLKQVGEDDETKRQRTDENEENSEENMDEEEDDSILGLASCISFEKLTKEAKKALKIEDNDSKIGWIVNE